ncbi:MAG: ATP-dependent DNA ligase [Candidatus Woesearchaeota archaeon]
MEYIKLAKTYEELESNSKRLKKTYIISELLKETKDEDLKAVTMLLRGKLFSDYDDSEIGISTKLLVKGLSVSMGYSEKEVIAKYREIGDLGEVAKIYSSKKTQNTLFQEKLSVNFVFETLRKLTKIEGIGSVDLKLKTISNLLTSSSPIEAKYIIRSILGELRVGVAQGTLRDAIAWAYLTNPNYNDEDMSIDPNRKEYNEIIDKLQGALDKLNDFVKLAKLAKNKEDLTKVEMIPGNPLKVMLAQKVSSAKEAFETVGKPLAIEYKYDGFRTQVHKKGEEIRIFTRRLEEVTERFPEVVKAVKENVKGDVILDGEAVGYDKSTGKYTTFQHISQRIKRKYDIEELAKKLPVELNVFDLLYFEGDYLNESFKKRREKLEEIITQKPKEIILSNLKITSLEEEVDEFLAKALNEGKEGLMIKNLKGIYKPGSRVGYMLKYKKSLDPLDLVVVKAEWGQGKRSGWLTSFTLACQDFEGELLEIGKVGTGLKEKTELGVSFEELTNKLKEHIISEHGREVTVKPIVVLSLLFEEIQKSPSYSSGYALRFPRVVALRDEKPIEEIATLEDVEIEYKKQLRL